MGRQPGQDGGTGAEPGAVPGLPARDRAAVGASAGSASPGDAARDPRLSGFAREGEWDACPPSASLAAALEAASGGEWRCPGATRDEMLGLLRQWQALESWAAAGKLGILRALVRDDDQPLPGGGYHGDLPQGWTKSLTHEVAAALAMSVPSAENLTWLAWNLQAMLPGTGALLAGGQLTLAKARAVDQALNLLTNEDAAAAEAMIVPELPGKTYGQVLQLAVQGAITVDPEAATRRREEAERTRSRVTMLREESGAAALSGRDLPTDQTLAAHASVCARAQVYKGAGVFPSDTRMDQFRAAAYLDLLNGITAAARIASGQLVTVTSTGTAPGEPWTGDSSCSCRECDGGCIPAPDEDDDPCDHDGPGSDGSDGPGDDARGGDSPHSGAPSGGSPESAAPVAPRLADLVLPLATLLGLAERPGEGHGLGPLDPDLCRELAIAAAASAHSILCVTVTDQDGVAIGHGCARPLRKSKARAAGQAECAASPVAGTLAALPLPSRANLTITAARLAVLASAAGPPGAARWSFTPTGDPGPPGGFGTWTLRLPDGSTRTVELGPVPTLECDHRHESHAYQPNDTLRHLVQIRDYTCTFPSCSRHARESDFEHAVPYDKGGRSCACNAGARSRQCHRVKQSPGWTVTQPKPGWHQWETPTGRVYTQGPKRYPT